MIKELILKRRKNIIVRNKSLLKDNSIKNGGWIFEKKSQLIKTDYL